MATGPPRTGPRRPPSCPHTADVERQEIADELSTAGAQALLASGSAAHLAYIAEDETPRVIRVGFFWTGDEIVISTATTSPKVTALRAHSDVALAIDAGDTPDQARALSIRGRAGVQIVDGVVKEYLAPPGRPWIPKQPPSSRRTSERCTTR
jgi:Pyridoxamine 5'-phosphate oxidase